MAATAGTKSTTYLSLLMEAYGLEVEEELWIGSWHHEQREAWMRQFEKFRCVRPVIWASSARIGIP